MSEHPPRTPEHTPEDHPETATPDLEHALEANTVPPTPEPPVDTIAETRERLSAHRESAEGEPAANEAEEEVHETATTAATNTTISSSNTTAQVPKKSFWDRVPGPIRGGISLFIFAWAYLLKIGKWTMDNFSLGKGGGSGGDAHAKKDDHGHGH